LVDLFQGEVTIGAITKVSPNEVSAEDIVVRDTAHRIVLKVTRLTAQADVLDILKRIARGDEKLTIKIDHVRDFAWATRPGDELLCYWTPEVENQPARVTLMSLPGREIVRTSSPKSLASTKPLFSAKNFSCLSRSRFQTATLAPWSAKFIARFAPMTPKPTTPKFACVFDAIVFSPLKSSKRQQRPRQRTKRRGEQELPAPHRWMSLPCARAAKLGSCLFRSPA
jgi:hypothetical protein